MRALIELWRWSSSGADGLAPASWCTFTLSILRSVFSGSHTKRSQCRYTKFKTDGVSSNYHTDPIYS